MEDFTAKGLTQLREKFIRDIFAKERLSDYGSWTCPELDSCRDKAKSAREKFSSMCKEMRKNLRKDLKQHTLGTEKQRSSEIENKRRLNIKKKRRTESNNISDAGRKLENDLLIGFLQSKVYFLSRQLQIQRTKCRRGNRSSNHPKVSHHGKMDKESECIFVGKGFERARVEPETAIRGKASGVCRTEISKATLPLHQFLIDRMEGYSKGSPVTQTKEKTETQGLIKDSGILRLGVFEENNVEPSAENRTHALPSGNLPFELPREASSVKKRKASECIHVDEACKRARVKYATPGRETAVGVGRTEISEEAPVLNQFLILEDKKGGYSDVSPVTQTKGNPGTQGLIKEPEIVDLSLFEENSVQPSVENTMHVILSSGRLPFDPPRVASSGEMQKASEGFVRDEACTMARVEAATSSPEKAVDLGYREIPEDDFEWGLLSEFEMKSDDSLKIAAEDFERFKAFAEIHCTTDMTPDQHQVHCLHGCLTI